jgi:glucokinase
MNENIVLGADIGGSHITASLVDIQNRKIISTSICRKDVDSAAAAESIVNEWKSVFVSCAGKKDLRQLKIGIAMPGPVDYDLGFCYIKDQNKYESLYGLNLKELLGDSLGIEPSQIRMINDAAGFLSGEMFIGAGKGYKKVVGLTLGTGLGSALYDHGTVSDADLWHTPFREGKAEDYISAPWLISAASRLTGENFSNVKQMADQAAANETIQSIFIEFGKNLADFLIAFIRKEGPELVILGGNVAKAYHHFSNSLTDRMRQQKVQVPVRVAEIGEAAALVGAAALWENNLLVPREVVLR